MRKNLEITWKIFDLLAILILLPAAIAFPLAGFCALLDQVGVHYGVRYFGPPPSLSLSTLLQVLFIIFAPVSGTVSLIIVAITPVKMFSARKLMKKLVVAGLVSGIAVVIFCLFQNGWTLPFLSPSWVALVYMAISATIHLVQLLNARIVE